MKKELENISMNGRIAYIILCIEKYLITKFSDTNWSTLSEWMWKATSSYWDEWANKFIEIVPEYLYEFETYEKSNFNTITKEEYQYFYNLFKENKEIIDELLQKLLEIEEIYSYSSIPGFGEDAIQIVLETTKILERDNVELPNLNSVKFSTFNELNGWGNNFDGSKISLILNKVL